MYSFFCRKYKLIITALFISAVSIFSILEVDGLQRTAAAYDLENDLPVIGSEANLQNLLQKANAFYTIDGSIGITAVDRIQTMEKAENAAAPSAGAADFSATNVQVEGVDEADMIKTDGNYIYQVSQQKLTIIKAFPAVDMKVVNSFSFDDPNFWPNDIYVDQNHLVVTGNSHYNMPVPYQPLPRPVPMLETGSSQPEPMIRADIYTPYYPSYVETSKVIVYDISDRAKLKKLREFELEGSVISTRKIGSSVYIAANRYINHYWITNIAETPLPAYRDSIKGSDFIKITLDKIRYFPDAVYPSYILIAALDLEDPDAPLNVKTYLGNGENVYASLNNLYVAVSSYDYNTPRQGSFGVSTNNTSVYKFALKPGAADYAGKGSVPGTILNQFSMDEHGSYFRIATTSNSQGTDGIYTTRNNVYVLDSNLQITGRLENIAPGERIYSTRFMGDRVYMVTFRNVDPFFVIDVKDPQNPQVLGQLKIPGYSDYLHPYDENHIIGFGKDTVEMKGWNGEPQAYYQGMKLAVFDVTDVSKPKEVARELIGDRGTDSELLRNHKALLFARDKNLLAFPVTLMEVQNVYNTPESERSKLKYGRFAFQGAYIYHFDLTNGFKLKGRITHLTSEDYLKAGDYWYGSSRNISRILYIGNTVYTISPAAIMAHDLDHLNHIRTLNLP